MQHYYIIFLLRLRLKNFQTEQNQVISLLFLYSQTIQEKDLKSAEVGAVFEVLYILELSSLCVVEDAVASSTYLGSAKLIHLH